MIITTIKAFNRVFCFYKRNNNGTIKNKFKLKID